LYLFSKRILAKRCPLIVNKIDTGIAVGEGYLFTQKKESSKL
jgi:hypothetical protein